MRRWTVVFDLDDTLFPEADFVRSGRVAVAAHLEAEYGATDALAVLERSALLQPRRSFDLALASLGLEQTTASVAELIEVYRAHSPKGLAMYPDAQRLLDALVGHANLAIVTDGWASSQLGKLDALRIGDLFDPIICTFDRGDSWRKPSTLAFQEIQDYYGATAIDCLYVGDNRSKDLGGPAELGWTTVLVHRPLGVHRDADPSEHRIDYELDNLDELLGCVPLLGTGHGSR